MPEPSRLLKRALLLGSALLATACTTVPVEPPRRPGPVVQQPQPGVPADPTDARTEREDEDTKVVDRDTEDTGADDEDADADADAGDGDAIVEYYNNRDGLTPPHMAGRDIKRLALLLPFSTDRARLREEANAMFQAAEMAVFARSDADVVLIALDTQGTESGARSAARAAINQGADVILGPVIGGNARAAAREARRSGTPVISFSNDQRAAGNGTYLLSFPPEAEVERVVGYAATDGTTRFAYLGPDDAYGRRVRAAFEAAVARQGGEIVATQTYRGNDIGVMQAPAQAIAEYQRDNRGTGRDIQAILLPEGGTALRSLAPLLPFNGVDPARVQFLGTSRWDDDSTVREPALGNGIFAAADKDGRGAFIREFERNFGTDPGALSSLAYDAVSIGAFVADGDPKRRDERLESLQGFYGADGFVRFGPDGRPERGLAVYRIRNGSFRLEDPAPRGPAPES